MSILHEIQQKLKAPKNQFSKFGNYHYRSCEDIVEAVKPLLPKDISLIINDDIISVLDRVYVKSTVSIVNDSGHVLFSATGCAREPETKPKFDESQLTGAASSYARKYALNGLFAIDDTKDADAMNDHKVEEKDYKNPPAKEKVSEPVKKEPSQAEKDKQARKTFESIMSELDTNPVDDVTKKYEKAINAFGERYISYYEQISAKVVELKNKDK